MDIDTFVGNIQTAVKAGRTDVVRGILSPSDGKTVAAALDTKLMDALNTVRPLQGTMLHMAARLGNSDVVRALLVSDVDPSIRDEKELSAFDVSESDQIRRVFYDILLQAVAQSKVEQVQKLLAAGLDVNYKDVSTGNNSVLHWAASFGNDEIVQVLLDCNAVVNVVNDEGASPLHEAVHRINPDIVKALIQSNADPDCVATTGKFEGKCPKTLAKNKPELLALFEGKDGDDDDDVILEEQQHNSEATTNSTANGEIPTSDESRDQDTLSDHTLSSTPTPCLDVPMSPFRSSIDPTASPSASELHKSAIEDDRLKLLWPQPQQLLLRSGSPFVLEEFTIQLVQGPKRVALEKQVDIWTIQMALIQDLGLKPSLDCGVGLNTENAQVVCQVNENVFAKGESYRLLVTEKQIKIICSDLAGMWYASCTFLGLLRLCAKDGIPQLQISDWPSLSHRGIMMDFSDGRILRIDYLLYMVNTLANLKFNQIHVYIRISKDSTPETILPYIPSALLDLEVYCNYRFMSITPHLDVRPDVSFSPEVFAQLRQVLSLFSNYSFVNIGPALTKKLLTEEMSIKSESGDGWKMNLGDKLRMMGIRHDHTVIFCANTAKQEELSSIPMGNIAAYYGSKNTANFNKAGLELSQEGIAFIVHPGTAAWNSLGGCPEVSVKNILNACRCCSTNSDAIGLVVSDWAGQTFTNQRCLSWPGFVVAAGCAWNTSVEEPYILTNLSSLMNYHIFQEPQSTVGDVILEIGKSCGHLNKVYCNMQSLDDTSVCIPLEKGSFLCQLIYMSDDVELGHMTSDAVQKVIFKMRKCQASLNAAKQSQRNLDVIHELCVTTDLILWACRLARGLVIAGTKPAGTEAGNKVVNVGIANLTATTKTDSANKLLCLIEDYRHAWLRTCHPSGLLDSLSIFSGVLEKLVPTQGNGQ